MCNKRISLKEHCTFNKSIKRTHGTVTSQRAHGARKNFVTLPIKNSYFKYAISLDYLFKASTFLRIELYLDSEELTLHIFEFRVNILRFISRKGVEFIVEIRRRE